MVDMGIRTGSTESAVKVYIGVDTVYLREGITDIGNELYTYHEYQFTHSEWNERLEQQNKELTQQLIDTQLALCEIYESLGGTV